MNKRRHGDDACDMRSMVMYKRFNTVGHKKERMGANVRHRLEVTHLGSGSSLRGKGGGGGGRGKRRWGIRSERRWVLYMQGKQFKLLPAPDSETVPDRNGETYRGP